MKHGNKRVPTEIQDAIQQLLHYLLDTNNDKISITRYSQDRKRKITVTIEEGPNETVQ